jgi:hypothetical protein
MVAFPPQGEGEGEGSSKQLMSAGVKPLTLVLSPGPRERRKDIGPCLDASTVQRFNILSGHYRPSGVVTSVPGGDLNSKLDAGTGTRVWFEYAVTMRSPFGSSISVRSTLNLSLIRSSSF